ncbi:MAG: DUF4837 family protein [Gelidibacter sp.]|nr:DUF4837 family protein [Gelidibacter sp.]
MKTLLSLTLSFLLLVSCNDGSKNQRIVPSSSGRINNLQVVVDNLLWDDSVGEAIRDVFAAPVQALNQEEPLFSISQMPPQVFTDFATKNRIILKIEKGAPKATTIKEDVYAKPQKVAVVSGETNEEIIEQLKANGDKIIAAFKKEEIAERQRQIKLSLHDDSALEKKLGITLQFPTAYRIAKEDNNFFWIRKDINTGTMDLMIYSVPLNTIKKGDSTIVDIIRMRDSIGKVHIPGPVEGSYMITEEAYSPYLFETTLDNKPTFETKGIWDVKNAFMSGPFINYAIEDKAHNRYLVIEGYVFAPSVEKRDHIFELEAIIKSIHIK